jgi:hypothetical protein
MYQVNNIIILKRMFIISIFQVKINVEISFFEIYNEKIHDLLASSKDKGRKSAVSHMYKTLLFFFFFKY